MRTHNGMRPQDVVVLLKIVSTANAPWQYRDIGRALFISVSEVSVSLQRSHQAGLLNLETRKIHRQSLLEFIVYGLRYVFPTHPSNMVTGIATGHSYPFYKNFFAAETDYA